MIKLITASKFANAITKASDRERNWPSDPRAVKTIIKTDYILMI